LQWGGFFTNEASDGFVQPFDQFLKTSEWILVDLGDEETSLLGSSIYHIQKSLVGVERRMDVSQDKQGRTLARAAGVLETENAHYRLLT